MKAVTQLLSAVSSLCGFAFITKVVLKKDDSQERDALLTCIVIPTTCT